MSPVISAIILTGTIVSLVTITSIFANNFLWTKMAESDFNAARQFMQNIGLQIDDVAWSIGRTQTLRYASRYGNIVVLPSALRYSIYIQNVEEGEYTLLASYEVSVILFNYPVSQHSIANGHYDLIYPTSTDHLMIKGTSAPVVRVFEVEKVPMGDGNYIRVVTAPSIRLLNSTVTWGDNSRTLYLRLYLPILDEGESPRRSQSVTLVSKSVNALTEQITGLNVTVSFPNSGLGFDNSFFRFPSYSELVNPPEGFDEVVLEVYTSEVEVSIGVHV